jgi:hypothetical protein
MVRYLLPQQVTYCLKHIYPIITVPNVVVHVFLIATSAGFSGSKRGGGCKIRVNTPPLWLIGVYIVGRCKIPCEHSFSMAYWGVYCQRVWNTLKTMETFVFHFYFLARQDFQLNLTSLNIFHKDFRFKLDKTFVDMTYEQLNKVSSFRSGKLYFYSYISNHADYKIQDYLKFPLKKTSKITAY